MLNTQWTQSLVTALVLVSVCSLYSCASQVPETSDPSSKEIKSDSDRMFDKMKQEERERSKGTEGTTR